MKIKVTVFWTNDDGYRVTGEAFLNEEQMTELMGLVDDTGEWM